MVERRANTTRVLIQGANDKARKPETETSTRRRGAVDEAKEIGGYELSFISTILIVMARKMVKLCPLCSFPAIINLLLLMI